MLTTTEPADGQEKKDTGPKAPFTTFVKYERVEDGKVTATYLDIPACAAGGEPHWILGKGIKSAPSARGDKITDADGNVYTVDKQKAAGASDGTRRLYTSPPAPSKYLAKGTRKNDSE